MDFDRFELLEVNGETKIVLYIEQQPSGKNDTEFASEIGFFKKDGNQKMRENAISFVKRHMPKLKVATIVVVAGARSLLAFR